MPREYFKRESMHIIMEEETCACYQKSLCLSEVYLESKYHRGSEIFSTVLSDTWSCHHYRSVYT